MSISLDSYSYEGVQHGALMAPEFGLQESIHTWWGVLGAVIQFGHVTHRVLTIDVTFQDYVSEAALRAAVATVQSHVMDNGTLNVSGIDWPHSAFVGFAPDGPPFRDGSGYHGWVQHGKFRFRQHAF